MRSSRCSASNTRRVIGSAIDRVRYIDIDYERDQRAAGLIGPRVIVDDDEWSEPTWQFPDCDSIDFGLELETRDGRLFSVTWDPPGLREGIGLREEPLLGTGVRVDGATAIWDVTNTSGWVHLLGRATSDVVLHCLPWGDPGGFWCPRITLRFPGATVELLLGEGGPNRELGPSADNVAVLFDPDAFPTGNRRRTEGERGQLASWCIGRTERG